MSDKKDMSAGGVWSLLKQVFAEYFDDGIPRLAAALSYYTAFALAPVLVVLIAVAGLVFGEARVRAEIIEQMGGLLGGSGSELVAGMLETAGQRGRSIPALIVGLGTILLATSGLFGELQNALNTVWEVAPQKGRGILATLRARFISFTTVVGVGFLLLVSLAFSAAVAAFGKFAGSRLPGWAVLLQVVNFVIGFGFAMLLFALIYKVLPDVKLRWSDVWTGAAVTAALFTLGRFLIGLYLGRSSVGSAYGAAGSLAIMLLWVYYSSQILLLGAEFTQVRARARGSWVEPRREAEVKADAHKGAVKGAEHAPSTTEPETEPETEQLPELVGTRRER